MDDFGGDIGVALLLELTDGIVLHHGIFEFTFLCGKCAVLDALVDDGGCAFVVLIGDLHQCVGFDVHLVAFDALLVGLAFDLDAGHFSPAFKCGGERLGGVVGDADLADGFFGLLDIRGPEVFPLFHRRFHLIVLLLFKGAPHEGLGAGEIGGVLGAGHLVAPCEGDFSDLADGLAESRSGLGLLRKGVEFQRLIKHRSGPTGDHGGVHHGGSGELRGLRVHSKARHGWRGDAHIARAERLRACVGNIGESDGWHGLREGYAMGRLTWAYGL